MFLDLPLAVKFLMREDDFFLLSLVDVNSCDE